LRNLLSDLFDVILFVEEIVVNRQKKTYNICVYDNKSVVEPRVCFYIVLTKQYGLLRIVL